MLQTRLCVYFFVVTGGERLHVLMRRNGTLSRLRAKPKVEKSQENDDIFR